MNALPRKPPFQFGLGSLLWLVLVCALLLGWILDRTRLQKQTELLQKESFRWQLNYSHMKSDRDQELQMRLENR